MRLALALGLALGACRSAPPPSAPPLLGNATVGDAQRWAVIEELARPLHDGPPTDTIERAAKQRDVGLLVQWMQESGTLRNRRGEHVRVPELFELGSEAIESATHENWAPVAAGGTLGLLLVQDGAGFLDADMGLDLVEAAARKLRTLGDPPDALERPRATDLVRIVAAEALEARAMIKSVEDAESEIPTARADFGAMYGDPDAIESLRAFWPVALHGARRDEAVEVTLARMRAAVASVPRSQAMLERIVAFAEIIAKRLALLESR